MLIITLVSKRKHPPLNGTFFKSLIPLSILGMALGQGLFLVGLKYTTSINSAILITCIPILTLIIVIIRKQEELTFNKFIGFVLAFLGVILIRDITSFKLGNETLIGDGLVFAGALCFALYLSYGKKFFMSYDNMWSTTWMFFISGFIMTLFNFGKINEIKEMKFDSTFISCALFSIIGATLLTYLLNNWALRRASSGSVAIFVYLQPIVAGIIGYLFLHEEVSLRLVICSLFIMCGLLFSIYDNIKLQKALKRKSD
jgi:drug/metabolite transporter (DMT)-like permease